MSRQIVILAAVALATISSLSFAETAATSSSTWEPPYVGSDPKVLYLPDGHAVYWRYGWKRQPGDTNGVVITARFPDARYFSYNVYNDDTKSSLGSFTDADIKTNDGGSNPFTGAKATEGTYKIHIVPEGVKVEGGNVLTFPDSVTSISFALRHYLPVGDMFGGVPLPEIKRFDGKTGAVSEAPPSSPVPKISKQTAQLYLKPLLKKIATEFEQNPDKVLAALHHRDTSKPLDIEELICRQVSAPAFTRFLPGETNQFYRANPAGTYPNKDNLYLAFAGVRKSDETLIIKFRAPDYPKSPSEYADANLRYFSISQGDENTYNYATTYDREIQVAADGLAYFIIGDDTPELRAKAKALGANFQPWLVHDKVVMIYRHMLPAKNFAHGIDKVPVTDKSKPIKGQEATAFIGDYAPTAKFVPTADLLTAASIPAF